MYHLPYASLFDINGIKQLIISLWLCSIVDITGMNKLAKGKKRKDYK